jgi:hypothetical protein
VSHGGVHLAILFFGFDTYWYPALTGVPLLLVLEKTGILFLDSSGRGYRWSFIGLVGTSLTIHHCFLLSSLSPSSPRQDYFLNCLQNFFLFEWKDDSSNGISVALQSSCNCYSVTFYDNIGSSRRFISGGQKDRPCQTNFDVNDNSKHGNQYAVSYQ